MKRHHEDTKASAGSDAAAARPVLKASTHRNALPHLGETTYQSLRRDCVTLYTYVEGSIWLAANAKPRCLVESLVAAVFKRHTHDLQINRETAGAEFWVQVRLPSNGDGDDDGPIDFHFDVDEYMQDEKSQTLTPHLSTVTYLSDCGAPTVVVGVEAPAGYRVPDVYGSISSAMLSFPLYGKHLAFDGKLLHGAVPVGDAFSGDEPRITLLVNIWLGHQPTHIQPMIAGLAERLTLLPAGRSTAAKAVRAFGGGEAGEAIGPVDAPQTLELALASSARAGRVLMFPFGRTEPPRHILALSLPSLSHPLWKRVSHPGGSGGGGGSDCGTLVLTYLEGGAPAAWVARNEDALTKEEEEEEEEEGEEEGGEEGEEEKGEESQSERR